MSGETYAALALTIKQIIQIIIDTDDKDILLEKIESILDTVKKLEKNDRQNRTKPIIHINK